MNYLKQRIRNNVILVLVIVIILIFFGCQVQKSTPTGHNCAFLRKDSIFIMGEHIHLLPENICSYTEDEWYVFEEDIDTNYFNID